MWVGWLLCPQNVLVVSLNGAFQLYECWWVLAPSPGERCSGNGLEWARTNFMVTVRRIAVLSGGPAILFGGPAVLSGGPAILSGGPVVLLWGPCTLVQFWGVRNGALNSSKSDFTIKALSSRRRHLLLSQGTSSAATPHRQARDSGHLRAKKNSTC